MDQEILKLLTKIANDLSKVQIQVDKLAINQENVIMPRLDLLYEGQKTIMNQLKGRATTEQVIELESTVGILVDATKALNKDMAVVKSDLAKLKQA